MSPRNSRANESLAYIYGNQGRSELTFEKLKFVCDQDMCTAEALYYLGISPLGSNNFDLAITSWM